MSDQQNMMNIPKRPCSAFSYFFMEKHAEMKNANPEMKVVEICRNLRRMWEEDFGEEEQRKKWTDMAKKNKERYEKEMKYYVPTTYTATCIDFPFGIEEIKHGSWKEIREFIIKFHDHSLGLDEVNMDDLECFMSTRNLIVNALQIAKQELNKTDHTFINVGKLFEVSNYSIYFYGWVITR